MKMFLAGVGVTFETPPKITNFNLLESFYYYNNAPATTCTKSLVDGWRNYRDFIIDSGAFSYMSKPSAGAGVDWDRYVDSYADLVHGLGIEKFIEMDIDSIVGLKEVERLRRRLENRVGKQCIPVWHVSRGIDYWKGMAKDYGYISIGGFVNREIRRMNPQITKLVDVARCSGAKVHGLGFMRNHYGFYSGDASSWNICVRYGTRPVFKNGKMTILNAIPGSRVTSENRPTILNRAMMQFIKFANMMETQ